MIRLTAYNIGACPRRVVYEHLGYQPEPPDARSERIMKMGEALEGLILDSLSYPVHDRQKKLRLDIYPPDLPPAYISMMVDGLATDPMGYEGLWVVEAKALNSRAFVQAKQMGVEVSHPQYLWQGACYWKAVGARGVLFELLNRDNGDVWCNVVTEDVLADAWAQVEDRVAYLVRHITSGVLPPRLPTLETWACLKRYCGFAGVCEYGEGKYEHIPHITDDTVDPSSWPENEILEESLRNYVFFKEIIDEAQEMKESAADTIKAILQQYGAKKVATQYYVASLTPTKRTSLDKNLIPMEILEKATKEKDVLTLRVRPTP